MGINELALTFAGAGHGDCVEASVDFHVRATRPGMRRHWSDLATTDSAGIAADEHASSRKRADEHASSRKRQRKFVDAHDGGLDLSADDFKRQA